MSTIIKKLRKLFPKGEWDYHRHSFTWTSQQLGLVAYKVAIMAPKYDGDDDSYETRLKIESLDRPLR